VFTVYIVCANQQIDRQAFENSDQHLCKLKWLSEQIHAFLRFHEFEALKVSVLVLLSVFPDLCCFHGAHPSAGRGRCWGGALGHLAFAVVSVVVVVPCMRPALVAAIVVIRLPWNAALNALVVFDM
jgi:hypothetical protein